MNVMRGSILGWMCLAMLGFAPEDAAAQTPATILDLQPFRQTETMTITGAGDLSVATLTHLNPAVDRWYVLQLSRSGAPASLAYHLENALPHRQTLRLDTSHADGLLLVQGSQQHVCKLWAGEASSPLETARRSPLAYMPLCDGRLYLRNAVKGHQSRLEATAALLRDKLRGGDKIVSFVRDMFFKDAYRQTAGLRPGMRADASHRAALQGGETPQAAAVSASYAEGLVMPVELGISLHQPTPNGVFLGQWYAAQDNPGIYVSVMQPSVVTAEILQSFADRVNPLDTVEATSLVYLVAFDLSRFDLGVCPGHRASPRRLVRGHPGGDERRGSAWAGWHRQYGASGENGPGGAI